MSDDTSASRPNPPGDVVNYSSLPSAPLVIPIIFFIVVGFAVVALILKLLRRFWDRQRKSDTYVFVNAGDEEAKLHYKVDNSYDSKLLPMTVRKRSSNGNINELYANSNSLPTKVEANVHDLAADDERADETGEDERDDTPLTATPPSTSPAVESVV